MKKPFVKNKVLQSLNSNLNHKNPSINTQLCTCETSNSHILLEQKCNEFFLFEKTILETHSFYVMWLLEMMNKVGYSLSQP